jgi:protein-tyrosine-phosphatase
MSLEKMLNSGLTAPEANRKDLHPETIQLMQGLGYDTSGFRSKSCNEFAKPDAPPLDFVFAVCDNTAGETCPVWPGQPMTAHRGIPDPAEAKAPLPRDAYRTSVPPFPLIREAVPSHSAKARFWSPRCARNYGQ